MIALVVILTVALAATGWAWWRERTAAAEARAQAAAIEHARTRFVSVLSHDLRQPLHALTLYLTALERRVDGDEARDILAKMDRAANALSGMLGSLFEYSRLNREHRVETVDVDLAELFVGIAAAHPEKISVADTDAIRVHTDPALLEQVLRQLTANAIRHGGGKAWLEVNPTGDRVEIAVRDEGPGIAIADQERMFEAYERLNAGGAGLGLGLAIARRAATLLRTSLTLTSAPGKGARFALSVPRASSAT